MFHVLPVPSGIDRLVEKAMMLPRNIVTASFTVSSSPVLFYSPCGSLDFPVRILVYRRLGCRFSVG